MNARLSETAFRQKGQSRQPPTPPAEIGVWVRADLWAFDTMRRGPIPQSLSPRTTMIGLLAGKGLGMARRVNNRRERLDNGGMKHLLSQDEALSLTVNGNWRMVFAFKGEDAVLVDYCDYH